MNGKLNSIEKIRPSVKKGSLICKKQTDAGMRKAKQQKEGKKGGMD